MATSKQLRQQIQAGEWDGTLRELYGAQEAALVRQRRRYCEALSEFERYFGPGRQVHLYSAPGRTELGGTHTDHQQGFGLAAAVDPGFGGSGLSGHGWLYPGQKPGVQ